MKKLRDRSGDLHVMPGFESGWVVRRPYARRCLRSFATKAEAISYARTVGDVEELVIHRRDGTVESIR